VAADTAVGAFTPLAKGVWGILATPFDEDGRVDHLSAQRQVDLYRQIGATGVVALGVFGEAVKLDAGEKRSVVETVTGAADDLPVVVGLAARATAPAREEAELAVNAARGDLAGLMVQVHSPNPDVVAAHFASISQAVGVGVVVQDYPLISGVSIAAPDLATAAAACGCAVAIKAEAPPTPPAVAVLSAGTGLPVFGGLGGVGLVDELAAGAAGAMTGFSYPEGLVATVDAWHHQGFAAARTTWSRWLPLANFEAQAGIGLALRKEILHRRGVLSTAAIRQPGRLIPKSLLPLLDQHLAHLPEENV
jgi:4-hydroxy-tetrahydrodipicolinate synthase